MTCSPPHSISVDNELTKLMEAPAAPAPDAIAVIHKDAWFLADGSELLHKRARGRLHWVCNCKRSKKKPTENLDREIRWTGGAADIPESGCALCPELACQP